MSNDNKIPLEKVVKDDTQTNCEPCKSNSKDVTATHFCTECEEFLCLDSFGHHQRLKATSKHLTITVEEYQNTSANNKQECGLCLEGGDHKDAVAMCKDCDPIELMCCECLTHHKTMKATKNHNIETLLKTYRLDEQISDGETKKCEPCKSNSKDVIATHFCTECEEFLCLGCFGHHQRLKATSKHLTITVEEYQNTSANNKQECGLCLEGGDHKDAVAMCTDCDPIEIMCCDCLTHHKTMKATKKHNIETLLKKYRLDEQISDGETKKCEPCKSNSKDVIATHFCTECEEFLCLGCFGHHQRLKATSKHLTITVEEYQNTSANNKQECGLCLEGGDHKDAVAMCKDCDPIEIMCCDCLTHHKTMKATKKHNIETLLKKYRSDEQKKKTIKDDLSNSRSQATEMSKVDPFQPGKPHAEDIPEAGSIHLRWSPPQKVYNSFQYQLRYKTTSPSDKWKLYEEQFDSCSVILKNLKSNTTFIFLIRMVDNEGEGKEGPYSEKSDEITTKKSAADHLQEFSKIVFNPDGKIEKRKLLLEEIKQARNEKNKTRSFYLGNPQKTYCKEKTILMVGATGTGKSTLVDFFINYIFGVNWGDHFRFTMVDLEDEEKGLSHNQALSQTQWITTYCLNHQDGSRLDYTLNIIDTPGFGDTRGHARDKEIVEQLRTLFEAPGETGVVSLDAVCFVVKGADARLTQSQKYIFNAVLSLFARDIADNINILITFADEKTPPVLAALKEERLAHAAFFIFNSSGLFADNTVSSTVSLPQMLWEMGCKSLANFFENIKTMKTKSVKQSADVLNERKNLEITIENVNALIQNALTQVDACEEEIKLIEKHKADIEANKNFSYSTSENVLVKKQHSRDVQAMICTYCKKTCHRYCDCGGFAGIRYFCMVMDFYGSCKQCTCGVRSHKKKSYYYDTETRPVEKTYEDIEKKYQKATNEKLNQEKVVQLMKKDLARTEQEICNNIKTVTDCTNALKVLALRPNPISVEEHFDCLIADQLKKKRPGFNSRIAALKRCKMFIK